MKKRLKLVLLIACVCMAAVGIAIWIIWNKPHRNVEKEKGIEVTSKQLVADYELNESLANAKYLDRAVTVSGKVV